MQYLAGVFLFVVGSFIGLRFADFDHAFHWLPLMAHRSLLTHSFLMPLLLFYAFRKNSDPIARLFVMGICLAAAVHLCFDLFPRGWYGYALIHVPFYGRGSVQFSQVWMLSSILVCLYLPCRLLRNMGDFYLALTGLIVTYGVCAAAQPRPSFFALIVLALAALTMFLVAPLKKDNDPDFGLRQVLDRP